MYILCKKKKIFYIQMLLTNFSKISLFLSKISRAYMYVFQMLHQLQSNCMKKKHLLKCKKKIQLGFSCFHTF